MVVESSLKMRSLLLHALLCIKQRKKEAYASRMHKMNENMIRERKGLWDGWIKRVAAENKREFLVTSFLVSYHKSFKNQRNSLNVIYQAL